MMKQLTTLAAATVLVVMLAAVAYATPSTTYWTPCTLDFQAPGVTHITYDSYVHPGNPAGDTVPALANDYGLTWGHAFKDGLAIEYGVDYLVPSTYPLSFNAKIGFPEKTLSPSAPAIEVGVFNVGTKSGVTNQDVVYGLVGRSLPNNCGRLSVAYYVGGNKAALAGSNGQGFMVAYDKSLLKSKDKSYDKVIVAADYASGKNYIGGGGVGLYYYFTPNIDLLAGPV